MIYLCSLSHRQHVGCYDTYERACCRSADPFCVTTALMDPDGLTHTMYATNASYCEIYDDPKNYDRCITTDKCCVHLPLERQTVKCTAFWWVDSNTVSAITFLLTSVYKGILASQIQTLSTHRACRRRQMDSAVSRIFSSTMMVPLGRYLSLTESLSR